MKKDKVLITGSSGFIGSRLYKTFLSKGYDTVGVDLIGREDLYGERTFFCGDILDMNWSEIQSWGPRILVHLAEPASVRQSYDDVNKECRCGLLGTTRMIEIWKKSPGLVFVYVSSAAVYGNHHVEIYDESLDCNPISPYGIFKHAAERLIRIMAEEYGLRYLILRPFSLYGPELRKQVIYDLTLKMLRPGGVLEITGTGKEARDFTHVQDCCDIIAGLVDSIHDHLNLTVNIGTGKPLLLERLVELLHDYTGSTNAFRFTGKDAPGNPKNLIANVNRLQSVGFSCRIPVEAELRSVVEYIKANQQTAFEKVP